MPVRKHRHGLGGHGQQDIGVIYPLRDAAGPDHFVVRVHAFVYHGPVVAYVRAGRGAGEFVRGREHEHGSLRAAAGMARERDTCLVHIRAAFKVSDRGERVGNEVPCQAHSHELELPVHKVVLARTALYGLKVFVKVIVLEALAFPEGVQRQHREARACEQLRGELVFRVRLAVVGVPDHQQHRGAGSFRRARDIDRAGGEIIRAGLQHHVFGAKTAALRNGSYPGAHEGRLAGQAAYAAQKRAFDFFLTRAQAPSVGNGFPRQV